VLRTRPNKRIGLLDTGRQQSRGVEEVAGEGRDVTALR
jgi:hypothetical protein